MAQVTFRDDFRQRLAKLHEEFRGILTRCLAESLKRRSTGRPYSPRTAASLVQALLHGLAVQLAADPKAFDHNEMRVLCLEMVGTFLWDRSKARKKQRPAANKQKTSLGANRGKPVRLSPPHRGRVR
jgi:hypothetical protein